MENTGWIKISKSILNWEWFTEPNMVFMFVYLIAKANYEDKTWRGVKIKRGQFITSINTICKETNLSAQVVRTCLNRLKSTSEITSCATNKYTIITICKYDNYQDKKNQDNKVNNKQPNKRTTNEQQTTNKQLTTTKEIKNIRNKEKDTLSIFDFKKSLIDLGVSEQIADDYITFRRAKKFSISESVFNALKKEIKKSGYSAADCLSEILLRGWQGFKAEWIINNKKINNNGNYKSKVAESYSDREERVAYYEGLFGK